VKRRNRKSEKSGKRIYTKGAENTEDTEKGDRQGYLSY
jgi:hypothetical protein